MFVAPHEAVSGLTSYLVFKNDGAVFACFWTYFVLALTIPMEIFIDTIAITLSSEQRVPVPLLVHSWMGHIDA